MDNRYQPRVIDGVTYISVPALRAILNEAATLTAVAGLSGIIDRAHAAGAVTVYESLDSTLATL